jgi:hypothetical protein
VYSAHPAHAPFHETGSGSGLYSILQYRSVGGALVRADADTILNAFRAPAD